jgi:hypothetical protein
MRSGKNPTSAAAEETIGCTQDVIEIPVQLAPLLTPDEADRPEKAFYCIHYESHLVPFDTKVSCWLNPDPPLRDGFMQALTAPFCSVGSGHAAFLGAVSKDKLFAAFQNRGCPLIRG